MEDSFMLSLQLSSGIRPLWRPWFRRTFFLALAFAVLGVLAATGLRVLGSARSRIPHIVGTAELLCVPLQLRHAFQIGRYMS